MVGVAVVGAGHWGPNIIKNLNNHQTSKVVWVIDSSADRLKLVKQRYPDVKTDKTLEKALADPNVDAVVIVTPTVTHYKLALQALEAGKHVLVEKPITASSKEGEHLCEVAEKNGLVLMVGHVFVYNPAVQYIRDYIEKEEVGKIYYISTVRTNLGPLRLDVNAAWDLAPHDISVANYWLGSTPVSVQATGASWINPKIEDSVFAVLRYPGDVLVNLHVSWLNPRKDRLMTVVGNKRMLTFDDMSVTEPVRIYNKGVTDELTEANFADTFGSFRASIREGDIIIPKVPGGEPLLAECQHFIECVSQGTKPKTSGRDGVAVVKTLEAISRSISSGKEEKVV